MRCFAGLGACLLAVFFSLPGMASAASSPKASVSVAVFDPAIPEDPSVYRDLEIFPRIREVEAMGSTAG